MKTYNQKLKNIKSIKLTKTSSGYAYKSLNLIIERDRSDDGYILYEQTPNGNKEIQSSYFLREIKLAIFNLK